MSSTPVHMRLSRHTTLALRLSQPPCAGSLLFLEHTQGCHSFARRDGGERSGANEHAFLRCGKHFDVVAVDIYGTRQELPLFDTLAEFRQSEEKTAALGADAEEIPHHVICFGCDACSVDHAQSDQTVANAAHAFGDYFRLKSTSFADFKRK